VAIEDVTSQDVVCHRDVGVVRAVHCDPSNPGGALVWSIPFLLTAAMHRVQRVLLGRGGVHSMQLSLNPEPGIVEMHHRLCGDPAAHQLQKPVRPPAVRPRWQRRRCHRRSGVEQLGQGLRAVRLLDRNRPISRYTVIRGPYSTGVQADHCDAHPATQPPSHPATQASPSLQLMVEHPDRDRRQIENLAPFRANCSGIHQTRAAPIAGVWLMPDDLMRISDLRQHLPGVTLLIACARSYAATTSAPAWPTDPRKAAPTNSLNLTLAAF
jgi:hypothetical protein